MANVKKCFTNMENYESNFGERVLLRTLPCRFYKQENTNFLARYNVLHNQLFD